MATILFLEKVDHVREAVETVSSGKVAVLRFRLRPSLVGASVAGIQGTAIKNDAYVVNGDWAHPRAGGITNLLAC
jgi:hypothetical protein